MTSILALMAGLLLRLALPIIGTGLLVYILRKLDEHWQNEAKLAPLALQNIECWKVKGCSAQQRKNCIAATSPLPCWQVQRLPNGYLREKCISCDVFINAPIPTMKTQFRRM